MSFSIVFALSLDTISYHQNRRNSGESKLKFHSVSRQLYRLRDKQYPKRPESDEDIKVYMHDQKIFDEYGKTLDNLRPLYVDSIVEEQYAFHVFASFKTIGMIEENIPPNERKYLIDGTFKVVPPKFGKMGQLLIICIEYKNDVSNYFLCLYHLHSLYPYSYPFDTSTRISYLSA